MGVESDLLPANGPEAGSSITSPPDHNIHLATWRISQFEGQLETPTSTPALPLDSRRINPFITGRRILQVGGALLSVLSLASDSKPVLSQNIASNSPKTGENNLVLDNTPPYQDILQNYPQKLENLTLTAEQVFENNKTTEAELRTKPDNIKDFKLVTNQQGNVEEIVVLAEDDKKTGTFVTRIRFNAQSGKYDKGFQTSRKPLSIEAESVVKVGTMILVGGQTEWVSGIPVLFKSSDSVRPFEPTDLSNTNLSRVAEMYQIPNAPSKVILVNGAHSAILDTESLKTVQTLSRSGSGVVVTATPENNQTAAVYSLVSNGLLRELINLSTGQVLENQLYFNGVYVDGYCFIKDSNGNIEKILVTEGAGNTFRILDLKTNSIKGISYSGWINHLEIPNMLKDSLLVGPIAATSTDRVWAVGAYSDGYGGERGGNGLVVLSWPLSSDPNTEPRVMTVYQLLKGRLASVTQQSLKSGVFSGKNGFLINFQEFGLVFIETKQDGSPIEGTIPIYLSIRDQAAPTANIPVVLNSVRN